MFAKIINQETKEVQIVSGEKLIKLYGATEMEVEQAYNGSWYVKGFAPAKPEPTTAEKVAELERSYGMTRWQREGILAEGSLYSDYTKAKAQEIEDLAEQLRTAEKSSVTGKESLQVEEVVVPETEGGWNG